MTLVERPVLCLEALPPDGAVADEPDHHVVAVRGDGDVGLSGAHLHQLGRGVVGAAVHSQAVVVAVARRFQVELGDVELNAGAQRGRDVPK